MDQRVFLNCALLFIILSCTKCTVARNRHQENENYINKRHYLRQSRNDVGCNVMANFSWPGGPQTISPGFKLTFDDIRFQLHLWPEDIDQSGGQSVPVVNIKYGDRNELEKLSLNASISYKFLIPGLASNGSEEFPLDVIGAYKLNRYNHLRNPNIEGEKVYMIVVNWDNYRVVGNISDPIWTTANYLSICKDILPQVANLTAEFIDFLAQNKRIISYDNVEILGHGLGAHIAGKTGEIIQKSQNETIGKITGLDAARPLFEFPDRFFKGLSKENAKFVEVIHSGGGLFGAGIIYNIGHADIYPSEGRVQSGWAKKCLKLPAMQQDLCAHQVAHQLYAYSKLFPNSTVVYKCKFRTGITAWLNHKPTFIDRSTPIKIDDITINNFNQFYCYDEVSIPTDKIVDDFVLAGRAKTVKELLEILDNMGLIS